MATAEEIRTEWKGIRSALGNLICYIDGKTEQLVDLDTAYQKGYADGKAEQEKQNEISFGDEVKAWDANSFVQFIAVGDEGDGWIYGFDPSGNSYRYPVTACCKTGKRWKVTEDGE